MTFITWSPHTKKLSIFVYHSFLSLSFTISSSSFPHHRQPHPPPTSLFLPTSKPPHSDLTSSLFSGYTNLWQSLVVATSSTLPTSTHRSRRRRRERKMVDDGGAEVTATTIKPCARCSHLTITTTIFGSQKNRSENERERGERYPHSSAKLF